LRQRPYFGESGRPKQAAALATLHFHLVIDLLDDDGTPHAAEWLAEFAKNFRERKFLRNRIVDRFGRCGRCAGCPLLP